MLQKESFRKQVVDFFNNLKEYKYKKFKNEVVEISYKVEKKKNENGRENLRKLINQLIRSNVWLLGVLEKKNRRMEWEKETKI